MFLNNKNFIISRRKVFLYPENEKKKNEPRVLFRGLQLLFFWADIRNAHLTITELLRRLFWAVFTSFLSLDEMGESGGEREREDLDERAWTRWGRERDREEMDWKREREEIDEWGERERLRPMYWTRKWVSKEVCQFVKKIDSEGQTWLFTLVMVAFWDKLRF